MNKKQTARRNDLDFEIQFFEAVLKTTPDFIEGLIALGDAYTRKGLYPKGLEIDLHLTRLRPGDPHILYNLACSYSLLNNIDAALATIKSAVERGYDRFEYLQHDSDLANLRRDRRYQEFISDLAHKRAGTRR